MTEPQINLNGPIICAIYVKCFANILDKGISILFIKIAPAVTHCVFNLLFKMIYDFAQKYLL